MPVLYDWALTAEGDGIFLAHGYVVDHPEDYLPDGLYIHTSPIQAASVEGGLLLLTTRSGNLYTLRPETIRIRDWKDTSECLAALGIEASFAESCVQARGQADQERCAEAEQLLEPGELLLEIMGSTTLNAFFHTKEGSIKVIKPWTHSGMFQDSVLIGLPKEVDLRYFPMESGGLERLEPYRLSDGLRVIKVRNLGSTDVLFGPKRSAVPCPAGELTTIAVADIFHG